MEYIKFDNNSGDLVVHRLGRTERDAITYDRYEGTSLRVIVHDNGSLQIVDGARTRGVYPSGRWSQVTPPPADESK